MEKERSLILIKHDGVLRGLIGKILTRFEDIGLKIASMKMIWADDELAKKHYVLDEEWAKGVFEKTKSTKEKLGEPFEFTDPIAYGKRIQEWNSKFLREGPVVAIVVQGPNAVEVVRKIVGNTEPRQAIPGTIRGDFASLESYKIADEKSRVLRNLIHASDSPENGKREISIWFNESELHNYGKELDKHF